MSEDITFKLQADETGALNALKRVRNEVLNNESGLKKMGQQARIAGKSLKDSASVLGPEFSILGDRIDHITGALGEIKGASLLTKASLVGLVAVGGFQVGQMIGNWVFETERWKEELEKASKEAERLNGILVQGAASRTNAMSADQLNRELEGTTKNVSDLSMKLSELKLLQDKTWMVDQALGTDGFAQRAQQIPVIEQELEAMRKLKDVYQQAADERQKQAAAEGERHIAKMIEEEAKAREQAAEANRQLAQSQEDYLLNLELELVKLRDGERAYTLMTLAKKGFTYETAQQALALQDEIAALREQGKVAKDVASKAGNASRVTNPGQVQGTEARFITRGIGMKDEQKILAETQKQTAKTAELVTVNKQLLAAIKAIKVA
jgi:hypothetical protein